MCVSGHNMNVVMNIYMYIAGERKEKEKKKKMGNEVSTLYEEREKKKKKEEGHILKRKGHCHTP